VRRLSDSVELVIEGAGMAPQLRQSGGASGWQGDLTLAAPSGLRVGPQRLSIPELGFQTITFDGSGSSYRIGINPVSGAPLGRPVVSADGQNLILSFPAAAQVSLPVARFNATQPGSIPQPSYAPPLQPRAVAPPLGDMAVGSMTMRNPGYLQVKGPNITLTFRNAPVRDALMAVARLGNYGFVYLSESLTEEGKAYLSAEEVKARYKDFVTESGAASERGPDNTLTLKENPRPVTVSFNNESFSGAVNAILAAGGLQGRLQGRTIFAGPNLLALSTYGPQLSKVYRLNQASAPSAAQYLASLGALISIPETITNTQSSGSSTSTGAGSAAGGSTSSTTNTSTSKTTEIKTYGGKRGPLLGVTGTIDSRLATVTLVGEPSIVSIAESYLRQIDLRQRQVALSVKILDVTLANEAVTENSFAFRFGNNFIVNDNGQLLGAFGRNLPANEGDFDALNTTQTIRETTAGGESSTTALSVDGSLTSDQLTRINNELNTLGISSRVSTDSTAGGVQTTTLDLVDDRTSTSINDSQTLSRVQDIISTVTGRTANTTSASTSATAYNSRIRRNPALNYPDNSFYDFVRSVITSESTKILASPTLVLSENSEEIRGGAAVSATIGETSAATIGRPNANESYVTVGEQVVTSYDVQAGQNGAPNTCQPEFGIAGLTFGARISKIDDNGFVTFSMSPAITASTRQQPIQGCGLVDILAVRRLDTGSARVRDGQTLIMTGVISDSDSQAISKWPILGDLPLVGQFFRSSTGNRDKRELVIMVTPKIINDYEGGSYGYGYQPETRQVRDAISGKGF
jgi:type IV pilus assembly protein PilQ